MENKETKILTQENYVDKAESAIATLYKKYPREVISSSKLRNLQTLVAEIYNEIIISPSEDLSSELIGKIKYLYVRFVYEGGRDVVKGTKGAVNIFMEETKIDKILNSNIRTKKDFIIFARYMEALIAFKKREDVNIELNKKKSTNLYR